MLTDDIATFFDQYILEAVDAIANIELKQIGKRFIDRKLIDLVSKNNVSKELTKLINIHLDNKKDDDFKFSKECFKSLWRSWFNKKYPETLLKFDSFLQNYFSNYREHFVHQFQVYLVGEHIINLAPPDTFNCTLSDLKKSWLLSASYHDCAYPLQKFDEYIQDFFKECIAVPDLGQLNIQNNYTEFSLSFSLEYIIDFLFKTEGKISTESKNKIRKFFYKQVTGKKNHGVLAGLGLIKLFEEIKKDDTQFLNIISPASTSIAIHDDDIWQCLSGVEDNAKDTLSNDINELKLIKEISLKKNPTLFLLILCDNLQDWGRPCMSDELIKKMEAADVRFKNIIIDKRTITIQLYFNNTADQGCTGYIDYKTSVFEKIKQVLKSPDIKFIIEYWNNINKEITPYVYEIN